VKYFCVDPNVIKPYVKHTSIKEYGGVELYLRTFLDAFAKLKK
jgi:hypothetical protein